MDHRYRDRAEAGDALAEALIAAGEPTGPEPLILALVRGGVPVAARVAAALCLPMDLLVIRKLGVPWSPEVGFGAIGPGGVRVLDPAARHYLKDAQMTEVAEREQAELVRREHRYRAGRPALDLSGRTAVLVDDGLATGVTAAAAGQVARALGAARTLLAVPVGAPDALARLTATVDRVICPWTPSPFVAVSRYYQDFPQVTDDEVGALLD